MSAERMNSADSALRVRRLNVATFLNTNLATLQTNVNNFLKGQALTAVQSGTVAYASGFVGEKVLVGQDYRFDGTTHVIVLWYAQ